MTETEAHFFESLKMKCKERGLDPLQIPVFTQVLNEKELQRKCIQYSQTLDVITYFLKDFLLSVEGIPILAVVSDEEGYVLKMQGDPSIKSTIQQLGIKEGVRFTEEDSGINSISIALRLKKPMQIIGNQHYHHVLYSAACYSVPIIDRVEEKVVGTISIMTLIEHANPLLLTLLSTVNSSIERELKLLRQNYQLNIFNQFIMNSTKNGIFMSNQNGVLIGYNRYAEHLIGIPAEKIIGKHISELDYFGSYLEAALNKKQASFDVEVTFVQQDNETLTLLLDVSPIFDHNQAFIGLFAQFRDITERKRTEYLLLNSEKLTAVGQMAASVAHEIRNPLTTIRGFIQFIEEKFSEKTYFDLILNELDRINLIISEFLVLSKPHVLNYQYKDIVQVLDETLSLFQAQAAMNNIQVVTDYWDNELLVKCDENQLKQMFMNLLKNSMEAMPYGGRLAVRIWGEKEEVVIEIQDEGCGMSSEQIHNLGNPFYTTKDTGTGLGYLVIKRIIDNHKGHFHVQSYLNKGTLVTITMPRTFND
ncbi:PAS domain-containing protein [Priestia megaterium]|nr:PAS domain-containing protein [Priestia megaterium]